MNVLIIGSGAREHAIAWKVRGSPRLSQLYVAPGNAGSAAIATALPIAATDAGVILDAVRKHRIDLVIVGPEDPLAAGLVDSLTAAGVATYGPTAAAARIESSKAWAKEIMARAGIPTARAETFDDEAAALARLDVAERTGETPPVVKADGLAAGKGVTVAATFDEAREAVRAAFGGMLGAAGSRVLFEERMSGPEMSAHAFCDGTTAIPTPYACDYKRVHDGDTGANTGGMGAYSPPGFVDEELAERVHRQIIYPAVQAMAEAGAPYQGTLYPGLMLTEDGPRVIEFNCRLGDPETQVLLPRLDTDLLDICEAAVQGRLAEVDIRWSERAAVGIVLTSGGYPGSYHTGLPISGLDTVDPDVHVFHAGTREGDDGTIITAGGRVLTVVATGATMAEARDRAYDNARRITFEGRHFRTDIALRELGDARHPTDVAPPGG